MIFKIKETKNYSMFDAYELNRYVKKDSKDYKDLKASMRKNGWCLGFPLYAIPAENGRYKIKSGHNRFAAAVELGIPVLYVVDRSSSITVRELEVGRGKWTTQDFFDSYTRQGNEAYKTIQEYCETTGIGLSAAIAMFSGHLANGGSGAIEKIKDGVLAIKDTKYPAVVASLSVAAKNAGFKGAANRNFVIALSKVAKTTGIDLDRLKAKMKAHPYLFQKCTSVDAYLELLQEIYNRQRSDKVPLAFMANAAAQARNVATPKQTGRAA